MLKNITKSSICRIWCCVSFARTALPLECQNERRTIVYSPCCELAAWPSGVSIQLCPQMARDNLQTSTCASNNAFSTIYLICIVDTYDKNESEYGNWSKFQLLRGAHIQIDNLSWKWKLNMYILLLCESSHIVVNMQYHYQSNQLNRVVCCLLSAS